MKNIIKGLCLLYVFVFTTAQAVAMNQGDLAISILGLKNNNGSVRIALYNSAESYQAGDDNGNGAYRRAVLNISNQQAHWRITNLPYGSYAIKFFHDEDNSGQFKKNLFGRPSEGYGFSNNPEVKNGPASYQQASFNFDKKYATVSIQTKN